MNTKFNQAVLAVLFVCLFTFLAVGNGAATVINVAAGLYTEDLTIPATKTNLEIVGAGPTSIIQGVATVPAILFPQANPNIEILASGVKIHGFTIKSPAFVAGNYSSGIVIGAQNVEIYSNAFQCWAGDLSNGDIGQAIQTYHVAAVPGVNVSGLNVHDNTFTHLTAGTWGYEAIYINRDAPGGILVTVQNNTFSGNLFRAVTVERSNVSVTGNSIITDLVPTVDGFATAGAYEGISVRDAGFGGPVDQTGITVTNNTIKGSGVGNGFLQGLRLGITGESMSSITVTGNTLSGNTTGVLVKDPGVADNVATQITLANNNIDGNATGVNNLETDGALSADNNWWGSYKGAGLSDGFRTGDSVSGMVTVTIVTLGEYGVDSDGVAPNDDTDANDDNDGYSDADEVALVSNALDNLSPAAPSNIYVNADFTGSIGTDPDGGGPATKMGYDAFTTIQAAINAAQ